MLKEMLEDNIKDHWLQEYRKELNKFSTDDQKDFLVMLEDFKNKLIAFSNKGHKKVYLSLEKELNEIYEQHKFENLFKLYFKSENLGLEFFKLDWVENGKCFRKFFVEF